MTQSKVHMDLKTFGFAAGARTLRCVGTPTRTSNVGPGMPGSALGRIATGVTSSGEEIERSPDVVERRLVDL